MYGKFIDKLAVLTGLVKIHSPKCLSGKEIGNVRNEMYKYIFVLPFPPQINFQYISDPLKYVACTLDGATS